MIVRKDKTGLDATRVPTAMDIAWAAGIYEGEGTCCPSGRDGKSFYVCVSQKDPELLYRLRDFFGGGIKLYNVGKDRRFLCYHWQLCGDRARVFLGAIYSFLTARRKAQIDSTSARVFLDCAEDLLALEVAARYEALHQRVEQFATFHRAQNAAKRQDYLTAYEQNRSKDAAYREKKRLAAQQRRQIRKEKLQVMTRNITAIA